MKIKDYKSFQKKVSDLNYVVNNSYYLSEILQFSTNLHFTLCVLNLSDEENLLKVDVVMSKLIPKVKEILGNKTLYLTPEKFDNFGNIKNTKVIFLKMQEDENYKKLMNAIEFTMNELIKENLLESSDKEVKLHLTIFNTTFKNSPKGFNAQEIYEFIKDVKFPIFELNDLKLSKMGVNKKTWLYDTIYSYPLI